MSLEEDIQTARELGRAIQEADDAQRWDDRRAIRTEWRDFLEPFRDSDPEKFFTLYHAHWDVQKSYIHKEPSHPVPGEFDAE